MAKELGLGRKTIAQGRAVGKGGSVKNYGHGLGLGHSH